MINTLVTFGWVVLLAFQFRNAARSFDRRHFGDYGMWLALASWAVIELAKLVWQ